MMGSSVGAAVVAAGKASSVLWNSEGRSDATRKRAEEAGLTERKTFADLLRESSVIISVLPPASALPLAQDVAAQGFSGVYVDANALDPATTASIDECVRKGGAKAFVDGSIIGPPAWKQGTTRLYLSGQAAEAETVAMVASLFEGSLLDARVMDAEGGSPYAASALKVAYGSWTKGSSALLTAVRAYALSAGVQDSLLAEWEISQATPGGPLARSQKLGGLAQKAWRFEGEMDEYSKAYADVPGGPGMFAAFAELYSSLAHLKGEDRPVPSAEELAKEALGKGGKL
eukprot:g2065.t1